MDIIRAFLESRVAIICFIAFILIIFFIELGFWLYCIYSEQREKSWKIDVNLEDLDVNLNQIGSELHLDSDDWNWTFTENDWNSTFTANKEEEK